MSQAVMLIIEFMVYGLVFWDVTQRLALVFELLGLHTSAR